MNEEVQERFNEARESLYDAQLLLDNGRNKAALNRAYYAAFYAAIGVLITKEIARSSHHGVISAFGHEFARTKLIDPKHHADLQTLFDWRRGSDYELGTDVSVDRVADALQKANDFVDACREFCR